MRLIGKRRELVTRVVGRLADGSDRATVTEERWTATVEDDWGARHELAFPANPTAADLAGALGAGPTTRSDREPALAHAYERWWRWKQTRAEAAARGLPAAVLTALQAREDATWTDYLAALQAWRLAPE